MTANTGKRTATPRRQPAAKKVTKKVAVPRRKAANPAHGTNRRAAEATIDALRAAGRLETIDSARVTMLQTLADAVDKDAANASLWREYRAAETALREVSDDDTDDFASLLSQLSAKVVDTSGPKPSNARSGGRSSS